MPFFELFNLMIVWVTFFLKESKLPNKEGLSSHSVDVADISFIYFINAELFAFHIC